MSKKEGAGSGETQRAERTQFPTRCDASFLRNEANFVLKCYRRVSNTPNTLIETGSRSWLMATTRASQRPWDDTRNAPNEPNGRAT
jgi:hypothetical protein